MKKANPMTINSLAKAILLVITQFYWIFLLDHKERRKKNNWQKIQSVVHSLQCLLAIIIGKAIISS